VFDGRWCDSRYIESGSPLARFAEPDVSIEAAKADLAKRQARASVLEAELAAELAEIERIKVYLELSERYGPGDKTREAQQVEPIRLNGASDNPTHEKTAPLETAPLEDEPLIEACRGKSIADAAIALIRLAGRPLSEEEIVGQFQRGRVTTVSKNPALNLRFALMRKRKETGAVELTADKKHWDLGDNPNPETGAERSAFFENRQRNNHAEISRQGLLAARERGAKHGRPFSITPDQKDVAEGLLAEGERVGEIAKLIGVSAATFNRWRKAGLVKDPRSLNPETTSSV
jgi:hypothetical protein